MTDSSGPHRDGDNTPRPAVTPRQSWSVPFQLLPGHLYKMAGLLFLLALAYRYFGDLVRVLLLVYAAVVLAVAFNAVIGWIPGNRRWKTGGLGLLIITLFGAILWFGAPVILQQLRSFTGEMPRFGRLLEETEAWIGANTGFRVNLVGGEAKQLFENVMVGQDGGQILSRARGLLQVMFVPILILFGGLFAVAKPNERLLTPILRAIPRERRPAFERVFDLLGERLLGWIQGTLLSMLIIGVLSTVAFYLLGLQYALLLGVLSGLFEVVPLLGPWVAGVVAVATAFLQDPQLALWTALVVIGMQQLESQVVTPLVMSGVAKVHPFVTLFSIVLFGTLFGLMGIFLALPLVLLFWTVVQALWVERAIGTGEDPIDPVAED